MLVTITQFAEAASGHNGEKFPIGGAPIGHEEMTADDDSAAMGGGCKMVRVATDTAMKLTPSGSTAAMYMPAGAVEYFAAAPTQTFAIAAV
jgi:hypothetical protein